MTDYTWPDDLIPYQMGFYLQAHSGGTESPFSRQTKVYGLSAPRWICSMSFRGGNWGWRGLEAIGPRLDAMVAKLKGRENRILIYDFRRTALRAPQWVPSATNSAASSGATTMAWTGLSANDRAFMEGDYIGGDGRPHIVTEDAWADASGNATVSFEPPLSAAVAAGAAIVGKPTAPFRLVSDDAGANGSTVSEGIQRTLDFVEDL